MAMTPQLRKAALTLHVTFSVGWLGAVAAFLALSIAGQVSRDAGMVGAAYRSTYLIGAYVIVPLSLGAFVAALVVSLGTHWGLFRHYWVVVKLVLTLGSTIL